MSDEPVVMWGIYRDMPPWSGWFMVRRLIITGDKVEFDDGGYHMHRTLAGARALVPDGLVHLRRRDDEPHVVVEHWL